MPRSLHDLARAASPRPSGTFRVDGLEGEIQILRDPHGIPHVRANSTHDAFFGQGWVHAQDRLWQMTYDRMRGQGRLAEYLGPAQVRDDFFMRRMRLTEASRADIAILPPDARDLLTAYASGVNAWVDQMPSLPIEFTLLEEGPPEPWEPWHCALTMKVRHVLMGSMRTKLWRGRLDHALGSETMTWIGASGGREDTLIVPVGAREVFEADVPEGFAEGSNNWAVHGSRTASGSPLLAGDPHRYIEAPNVYYQNRVACPEFDAIGLSMPGVPGMFHFGHNRTAAWCITHAMADTQDLFVLDEDAVLDEREETIEVRGAEPVTITAALSAHGPVVLTDPPTALRWTGTDEPNATLASLLPILRARTVAELDEAMRPWVDPCNCVLMADTEGSIAFLHRGQVPVRNRDNAWSPVPADDDHTWTGRSVPFEELPRMLNPDPGYIVTANNRIIGADYPHHLGMDYAAPSRARRILERLAALDEATAEDMARIHADRISLSSMTIARLLADHRPAAGPAAEMHALIAGFDGAMDGDSTAAAACSAFRDALATIVMDNEPYARLNTELFPEEPDPMTPRARIRTALPALLPTIAPALIDKALVRTAETLGAGARWDDHHRTIVRHPLSWSFSDAAPVLDPPHVAMGGEADCVQAGSAEDGLGIEHTSVARYVFDVGDWERSAWIVPLGSSGHPGSPHYADQAEAWARVELIPMTYDWAKVEAAATGRTTLQPR